MATICNYIEILYIEAVSSGNECIQHDLRIVYHMAKKMNRKLLWYKTGRREKWTDKDVDKRLDELKEIITCMKKLV